MSRRANYVAIGMFVIVAVAITVAAVIILGAGELFKKQIYMESYFDESVQGLDVGSPVKYRGVTVGKVEEITFVDVVYNTPQHHVMVIFSVIPEAFEQRPGEGVEDVLTRSVAEGIRIRLKSQGITGVSFLEVDYLDPDVYKAMEFSWTPTRYYVPSAPSILTQLTDVAESVFKKLQEAPLVPVLSDMRELVTSLRTLVDQDLAPLVKNAREASVTVPTALTNLTASAGATLADARPVIAELRETTSRLPGTIDRLDQTIRRLDQLIAGQDHKVEEILGNLQQVSRDLKELTEYAKKYPSHVLFGEPPPPLEVEP